MRASTRLFLFSGLAALLTLAGCGRGLLLQGERASWRHEAEVQCLQSGAVKTGTGVVQIQPIEGPGMCGADFPLKVAALGESSTLGYSDVPRQPGGIANTSAAQMPNWPPSEARYAQPMPAQAPQMRWVPGPPAIGAPDVTAPQVEPRQYEVPQYAAPQPAAPQYSAPAGRPISLYPQGVAPPRDDIPDDAILPPRNAAPQRLQPAYNAPVYAPPPRQRYTPPALGPSRGPQTTGAILPATVTPTATLSCPIVSALDRWVSEGVQPAALHWFGVQVTEIKQISAYSCRSMVGAGEHRISEHAFGNALDIAGFTLADGRKITVKNGWRGSPEEQGFLHDVQLYACETFTTVLAPGYNIFHYDHIHVDLMRRTSGRTPCRPAAIKGEVVAAKARALYASRRGGTAYTGSIATPAVRDKAPIAIPGDDGFVAEDDSDATVTGSITARAAADHEAVPGADGDFEDDATASITPKPPAAPRSSAEDGLMNR